jgi:hypothetical protein
VQPKAGKGQPHGISTDKVLVGTLSHEIDFKAEFYFGIHIFTISVSRFTTATLLQPQKTEWK